MEPPNKAHFRVSQHFVREVDLVKNLLVLWESIVALGSVQFFLGGSFIWSTHFAAIIANTNAKMTAIASNTPTTISPIGTLLSLSVEEAVRGKK